MQHVNVVDQKDDVIARYSKIKRRKYNGRYYGTPAARLWELYL